MLSKVLFYFTFPETHFSAKKLDGYNVFIWEGEGRGDL